MCRPSETSGLRPNLVIQRSIQHSRICMTIPTSIMHGSADVSVPPEITAHVAKSMIASARYIEYERSGHAIGIKDSLRVNADLLAFLQAAGR